MSEFVNIDSWMDIVDHALVGLVLISVAAIPSWFALRNHTKIQAVSDQVTGVAAQVTNGHTTPMREDVDGVRRVLDEIRADQLEIQGDIHGMKSDVSDIRSELRQERKDRIDLDDRFEKFKRDR